MPTSLPRELLPPPSLSPVGLTRPEFAAWVGNQQRARVTWRLACGAFAAQAGNELLLRYDNGLEVLIGPNVHPDAPPYRATPFENGVPYAHTTHASAGEALSDTLQRYAKLGRPVVATDEVAPLPVLSPAPRQGLGMRA